MKWSDELATAGQIAPALMGRERGMQEIGEEVFNTTTIDRSSSYRTISSGMFDQASDRRSASRTAHRPPAHGPAAPRRPAATFL